MIGYIYKIQSNCGKVLYIGSTITKLNRRFNTHKHNNCSISKYLNDTNYTFSNKCELIKEYEVVDRKHLLAYEQLYINKFKKNINTRDAFGLLKKQKDKEYREANNKYYKDYYESNKDTIKQKSKEYREANKNRIKQYKKEYYQKSKEQLIEALSFM